MCDPVDLSKYKNVWSAVVLPTLSSKMYTAAELSRWSTIHMTVSVGSKLILAGDFHPSMELVSAFNSRHLATE